MLNEVDMNGTRLPAPVKAGLQNGAPATLFEFVKDLGSGVYTQLLSDGPFKRGIHVWSKPGLIDLLKDPSEDELTNAALSLFAVLVRLALPEVFTSKAEPGQFVTQYIQSQKSAVFTVTNRSSGEIIFTFVVTLIFD